MVSRSISFRRLIESMPGDPTVKMRDGSSPSWASRRVESALLVKCRCDILLMAWRIDSSIAPSVTSPPNRWAIGSRMYIAACAAAKVS